MNYRHMTCVCCGQPSRSDHSLCNACIKAFAYNGDDIADGAVPWLGPVAWGLACIDPIDVTGEEWSVYGREPDPAERYFVRQLVRQGALSMFGVNCDPPWWHFCIAFIAPLELAQRIAVMGGFSVRLRNPFCDVNRTGIPSWEISLDWWSGSERSETERNRRLVCIADTWEEQFGPLYGGAYIPCTMGFEFPDVLGAA